MNPEPPTSPDRPADGARSGPADETYEPPRLDRLGTLAELTQGGVTGPDDGLGGAGGTGSL